MTASQYKNIIEWTLFFNKELENMDNIKVVRHMFDALGVALPNGTLENITRVVNRKDYLGWRPCPYEDAQKYADHGIVTMMIDEKGITIIVPDKNIPDLSYNGELKNQKNKYIKHITELEAEQCKKAQFFVYSYGYNINKNKK